MAARSGGKTRSAGLQRSRQPGPAGATPNPFLLRIHVGQGPASMSIGIGKPTAAASGVVAKRLTKHSRRRESRLSNESVWNAVPQGVMSRAGQYALL
jgi:hypothetical protein